MRDPHGDRWPVNPRSICLCVDDFGLHDGVNEAVLRLCGMGRVQAVGCMVGAPAWKSGSGLARRLDGDGLDLGLHLDLTECPVLAGTRRPLRHLILATQLRRLQHEPLRAEIRAQLDAFESAIGHAPAFIDGHQHVHQFPVVRDALLDEVALRYGADRPWLRSTRAPRTAFSLARMGWRARIKPWVIEHLGAAGLDELARRRGFRQNRALLGVYSFKGGAEVYRKWLAAWLEGAQNGDLLMCHPSLRLGDSDPLLETRVAEFEVLAAPSFDALVGAMRITLRPMSQILAATRPNRQDG